MFILAIETTGPYGSVALLDGDGNVLGYEVSRDTMSHLKDLIPMVDTVLKKSGVSKNEINLIAPSVGPGSFTGIRIGVSTARALCQALGIRAVPVPTLEAFCFKESAPAAARCQEAGVVTSAACDGAADCEAADGGGSAASAVCAIINARIARVVYGAPDPKAGSCGTLTDLFALPYNHRPSVEGGLLEEESREQLQRFFRALREHPPVKTWKKPE